MSSLEDFQSKEEIARQEALNKAAEAFFNLKTISVRAARKSERGAMKVEIWEEQMDKARERYGLGLSEIAGAAVERAQTEMAELQEELERDFPGGDGLLEVKIRMRQKFIEEVGGE